MSAGTPCERCAKLMLITMKLALITMEHARGDARERRHAVRALCQTYADYYATYPSIYFGAEAHQREADSMPAYCHSLTAVATPVTSTT